MTLPRHAILVCINERPPESPKGSCKPRGSVELFDAIKQAVFERGLKGEIAVNSTSCLKTCPFGATVAVWPEGAYYRGMTPDRVDELIKSIQTGKPMDEWRVPEDEVGRY